MVVEAYEGGTRRRPPVARREPTVMSTRSDRGRGLRRCRNARGDGTARGTGLRRSRRRRAQRNNEDRRPARPWPRGRAAGASRCSRSWPPKHRRRGAATPAHRGAPIVPGPSRPPQPRRGRRGAPRLHRLQVRALARADPLEEVEDQVVDGLRHGLGSRRAPEGHHAVQAGEDLAVGRDRQDARGAVGVDDREEERRTVGRPQSMAEGVLVEIGQHLLDEDRRRPDERLGTGCRRWRRRRTRDGPPAARRRSRRGSRRASPHPATTRSQRPSHRAGSAAPWRRLRVSRIGPIGIARAPSNGSTAPIAASRDPGRVEGHRGRPDHRHRGGGVRRRASRGRCGAGQTGSSTPGSACPDDADVLAVAADDRRSEVARRAERRHPALRRRARTRRGTPPAPSRCAPAAGPSRSSRSRTGCRCG